MRCILVTGLPATGKTTLAGLLAARYQLPLLAKDAFKEQLLDASGAVDAARSRELSNLSFSRLFAELRTLALAGHDAVLEGNFRAGEHEAALRALPAQMAQVLCRVDPAQRLARIAARAHDPARHPGHGDFAAAIDASNDAFLDLRGPRLICGPGIAGALDSEAVFLPLDQWWHECAPLARRS